MDFPISASPSSTALVAGAIALLTLGIGAMFAWFAFSASNLAAAIEGDELRIAVPIYGRSISLESLDVSSLAIVDLNESTELRPRIRTNGIGLPGYAVGWFRLGNGEKALAAVTTRNPVVYLRTTEGYSLLLSLAEPQEFAEHLRR